MCRLGRILGPVGSLLGGILGQSWGLGVGCLLLRIFDFIHVLRCPDLGGSEDVLRGHLEWSWVILDASWSLRGGSWEPFGLLLGPVGGSQGPLRAILGASWSGLGAYGGGPEGYVASC